MVSVHISPSNLPRFSRKTSSELFTHTYGFGIGTSGIAYLGLGTGFILASVVGARFLDKVYAHYRAQNNGVGKPEMRIPALIIGSLFIPVGLLYVHRIHLQVLEVVHDLRSWYGWSAQAKIHWIMPIIGTGIFGFGLMTCL